MIFLIAIAATVIVTIAAAILFDGFNWPGESRWKLLGVAFAAGVVISAIWGPHVI